MIVIVFSIIAMVMDGFVVPMNMAVGVGVAVGMAVFQRSVAMQMGMVMADEFGEAIQAGDGVYVRADNSNIALRTISKQLSQIQKGEIQTTAFADYADKFYIFAWIAFFILVIEFFILNRQNKQLNKYKWF